MPCILKYILLAVLSSFHCPCYVERGSFIRLPFAAGLLCSSRGADESRDSFKCYVLIAYQSTRARYVRKVVDTHQPPSHLWKAERTPQLVTGPRSRYRAVLKWGGSPRFNSQVTRLHFNFLYNFSEDSSVLLFIKLKQIRRLCSKSWRSPAQLSWASLPIFWGTKGVTGSTSPRNTDEITNKPQIF